ncbi:ABC transporter permease [Candidatus Izemoplasma sp. B36]|uniref:ABC transporter permease n=1 Tax=Candidatus Izemoplasma sp. B36 TaxID=3242468 RepID=UPI003557A1AD
MKPLLKYDYILLKKTKKLLVFPILFIVFATISVLSARFMNEILASLMTEEGVIIELPDPTMINSYITYVQDLFEITLFIIIFVVISYFITDKTKGNFPLILSKPIKPSHYILSKYLSINALIIVSTIIGHLFFLYYTNNLFEQVDMTMSLVSLGLFICYVLFITSVAFLASIIMKQYLGALIVTFAAYLGLSLLSTFKRFEFLRILPGSIPSNIQTYILDSSTQYIFLGVICSIALSIIILLISIKTLNQKDIRTN